MNRPNRPLPGHGWQATPGQAIPRAARQPAANGLLLVMVLLVWFSPLSIVAWLLGQAVILLQRRWHWWRFTLASLAWIALVLAVTGPQEALRRHIFVPQHFWQYVALMLGFAKRRSEFILLGDKRGDVRESLSAYSKSALDGARRRDALAETNEMNAR